jgi:mannose-6-phosphate isomerase-like protein (cupin superfamily)
VSQPISRENAEHYTWGNACDGWHLVREPQLGVIEERMPPGAAEVRHYHQQARQFFYILAGEAVMEVDGRAVPLSAGEGLHIAPGVPHQIRNESGDPVRFLVVSQPHSHGDRVVAAPYVPRP